MMTRNKNGVIVSIMALFLVLFVFLNQELMSIGSTLQNLSSSGEISNKLGDATTRLGLVPDPSEKSETRLGTSVSYSTMEPVSSHSRVSMLVRQDNIDDLIYFSSRFYIYTEPAIAQDRPAAIDPRHQRLNDRVKAEEAHGDTVRELLKNHSLRTLDPDQADLFIVPTPIGRVLTHKGLSFDEAFNALTSHPMFLKHGGNKHIMMSFPLLTFSNKHKGNLPQLSKWYGPLANVTVAVSSEPLAGLRAYQRGDAFGDDYEAIFSYENLPLVHHSFSVGKVDVTTTELPYREATWENFVKSKYFIFYRTRPEGSFFDATRFRHAPIHNVSIDALPRSSIGFEIPKEEWLDQYPDSKFCLAIRGDSPHTHALYRSVKVGCIPVVISDWYAVYTPTFKSTLRMEDYCIFIDEAKFIADPQGELLKLKEMSPDFISEKLKNLAFAQRVMMPDHPESLYVPAFLSEAQHAMKYRAPLNYQAKITCGCPSSCDQNALQEVRNGLPFSCEARIRYVMTQHAQGQYNACASARLQGACGPQCDPKSCAESGV